MARSDLLKKLLRAAKSNDQAVVRDATLEIIEDEKRKNHALLAQELAAILANGQASRASPAPMAFDALPKDADRGSPLLDAPGTVVRASLCPKAIRSAPKISPAKW